MSVTTFDHTSLSSSTENPSQTKLRLCPDCLEDTKMFLTVVLIHPNLHYRKPRQRNRQGALEQSPQSG